SAHRRRWRVAAVRFGDQGTAGLRYDSTATGRARHQPALYVLRHSWPGDLLRRHTGLAAGTLSEDTVRPRGRTGSRGGMLLLGNGLPGHGPGRSRPGLGAVGG